SFFLMVRLSSRSSLFPYTTLFRSIFFLPVQVQNLLDSSLLPFLSFSPSKLFLRFSLPQSQISQKYLQETINIDWDSKLVSSACPDRKSTRLNSSHVKISYAVLCLK